MFQCGRVSAYGHTNMKESNPNPNQLTYTCL